MTTEWSPIEVKRALLDPSRVFDNPMAVVNTQGLADNIKIEILRCWEYDAREMAAAKEEGLRNRTSTLESVLAALHALGAAPEASHSTPTRQGNV